MIRKLFESLNGKNVDERLQEAASQLRNLVEKQALRVGNFSQYEHTNTNVNPRLLRSTPSPEDRAVEKLPFFQKCQDCGRIVFTDPDAFLELLNPNYCDFCGHSVLIQLTTSQRNEPLDLKFLPENSSNTSARCAEEVIRRANQLMGNLEFRGAVLDAPPAVEPATTKTVEDTYSSTDASSAQVVNLLLNIQLDKQDTVLQKRIELNTFENQVVHMQLMVERPPQSSNETKTGDRFQSESNTNIRSARRSQQNATQTDRQSQSSRHNTNSVSFVNDTFLQPRRLQTNAATGPTTITTTTSTWDERLETTCRNIVLRQRGFTEKFRDYVNAVLEMFEIALTSRYRIRVTPKFHALSRSTLAVLDSASTIFCSESKINIILEMFDPEEFQSIVSFGLSLPVLRDAIEQRPEIRQLFDMQLDTASLMANVNTAAEAEIITQSLHALLVQPSESEGVGE